MNRILLKDIYLNGDIKNILIEGKVISAISDSIDTDGLDNLEVVDCKGKAAIPGFINMHTHSGMTLMRGFNEDSSLMDWLQDVWRIEPRLDDELLYWGTKLACVEMIKTGTTCFLDQYWRVDVTSRAVAEMGIRSVQAHVALDMKDESKSDFIKSEFERIYKDSQNWDELNTLCVGIHAPYSVSDSLIKWCSNFAREKGLKVHIHVSETAKENADSVELNGCSPFEHLEKLGVLGPEVIAAHCVWLSNNDMDIMAKYGVTPVHNINSNLKLSSGYKFLYNELKERGINVTLGTDGNGSSNNLDMRETMKTAALLQKGWREDPTALPLNELMDMATVNGAKALGIDAGEIKVGKLADINIIDIDNYAFTPNINFLSNLVYSANSSCVESVICNGKFVMKNRVVEGEKEILEKVNSIYKKLYV
ncbi:MAG: amidohydrolase [Bacteroidales bacterium]|nr:amidohydrolase [Bacteroidales bacterium]MBQ5864734.1 amidohydrolase [Bacteroidales bacterium]